MVKHSKTLAGKILLLVGGLFAAGLAFSGCVGLGAPQVGWSGVAIADGALFFGSIKGELIALELNGNPLWQALLEESGSAGGFGCAAPATSVAIYGTPAVSGELIYTGGYNGKVYTLNSSTGALRWVYPRQGNLQPIVGGLVVAQGKLYFGSADGKVYALDAATGDKEWEFPTGDKIWSTPAVSGDTLFIGSFDNKLYALDTTDGSKRWEFATEGAIVSRPLVYNNTVYFGSFDRYFYAVDAASGQLKWKSQEVAEKWFWASPVAYNNTIYAPSSDGRVYVFNADSGAKIKAIDLGSPISSSPVVVNSNVIIATEEGKIYSIDTTNNQKSIVTTLKTPKDKEEKIYASLSASDGVVYIHSQEGILYEVDVQTRVVTQLYQIN